MLKHPILIAVLLLAYGGISLAVGIFISAFIRAGSSRKPEGAEDESTPSEVEHRRSQIRVVSEADRHVRGWRDVLVSGSRKRRETTPTQRRSGL